MKSYSDGTPQVTYTYGDALPTGSTAVANALGRPTQTSNSISATKILSYDALGRVTGSSQNTQGSTSPYAFSYGYNLAGALTSETLPSGRIIATSYDAANRPSYLQGNPGSTPTNYIGTAASPIQYTPHGATWSFSRGNGLTHTEDYNTRLQLVQSYESLQNTNDPAHMLFVSCPQWGFGAVSTQPNVICPASPSAPDNGNLLGYIEKLGTPGTTSYATITQPSITYDGVNRLTGITETNNWSRSFAYDQWGNMSISSATGITQLDVNAPTSSSVYNAKNQRTDAGLAYDAAGNLNAMNLFTAGSIQYDAENRLVAESHPSQFSYGYDGNGQRVTKNGGGNVTTYVYDAAGQLSAEYTSTAQAAPACTTCYLSYDHLGSVRLITNASGTVVSRHDFLPFGEEIPASIGPRTTTLGFSNTDYVTQKFTGKERDSESGLDYFGARYYGSALGRFTSPDWSEKADPVPYARIGYPQSLNLYSYVENGPLSRSDLDGHYWCNIAPGSLACENENAWDSQHGILTDGSKNAIANSALTDQQQKDFTKAVEKSAGGANIDPNILVGIAQKESTLGANMNPAGAAKGLYGIEGGQMKQMNKMFNLDMTTSDLLSLAAGSMMKVSTGVADYLGHYANVFSGRTDPRGIDIAIGVWRVGVGNVRTALRRDNFWDYVAPNDRYKEKLSTYIDAVERYTQ